MAQISCHVHSCTRYTLDEPSTLYVLYIYIYAYICGSKLNLCALLHKAHSHRLRWLKFTSQLLGWLKPTQTVFHFRNANSRLFFLSGVNTVQPVHVEQVA